MLLAKPEGCSYVVQNEQRTNLQTLSKSIGKTLSSYTQAINIQNKTTGSLFQKKTKAKCLTDLPVNATEFLITDYLINCLNYIHLNPLEAKLVSRLENWPYSSWLDYYGSRNGGLCNRESAIRLLGLSNFDILAYRNFVFNKILLERIW